MVNPETLISLAISSPARMNLTVRPFLIACFPILQARAVFWHP